MIKNWFYLIVGVLSVLFAFTHTWNGLQTSLSVLNNVEMDGGTKTTFTYIWHIIGIENLVFGIALLIMAFQKNLEKVKFTAWVIIAILIMRLIIVSIFSFINNTSIIEILIDSIAILVAIALLYFGTRIRNIT